MHQRHQVALIAVAIAAITLLLCAPRGIAPPLAMRHIAFGHGSTVVLVHGLGSRSTHWLPTARLLARKHRVVLVDLPGHGDSEMPAPFSLDRATEALDMALAHESRDPVVLVGHSVGGLVAAVEALDHPERVRALVLVETALRPQIQGVARDELLASLDRDYQGILRSAYLAFGRDSAQGAKLYAQVAALDSSMIKPWIRLAVTADLSTRIAHLEPPMLVVLAERSWPENEAWKTTARVLGYEEVPHVQAMRIAGCGHFVMLDRPVELAQAIERFIALPEVEPIAAR